MIVVSYINSSEKLMIVVSNTKVVVRNGGGDRCHSYTSVTSLSGVNRSGFGC